MHQNHPLFYTVTDCSLFSVSVLIPHAVIQASKLAGAWQVEKCRNLRQNLAGKDTRAGFLDAQNSCKYFLIAIPTLSAPSIAEQKLARQAASLASQEIRLFG